jgi:hypothetical protein
MPPKAEAVEQPFLRKHSPIIGRPRVPAKIESALRNYLNAWSSTQSDRLRA